jgi:hypothetical protein
MGVVISELKYYWESHRSGSRHWYKKSWMRSYSDPSTARAIPPRGHQSQLGTVTRNGDIKSPYFNKWFAVCHALPKDILSGPLPSLVEAKAWLEVVERLNRKE